MAPNMRISEIRLHPIAIADAPLRSSYGRHAPYALRTIVELKTTTASPASAKPMAAMARWPRWRLRSAHPRHGPVPADGACGASS